MENRDDLSTELHNTLLELYLEAYKKSTDEQTRSSVQEKIMNFLKNVQSKEVAQALLLCQMHNFTPGTLFLYEAKGMYTEILQYAVDRKDYGKIMDTCRSFGEQIPQLWVQAFWFLARNFGDYDKAFISEVLKVIEKQNLLPPLMVVDILSRNPNATLDVIRVRIPAQSKLTSLEKINVDIGNICTRLKHQVTEITIVMNYTLTAVGLHYSANAD